MDKQIREKVEQLQVLEQNLQNILIQKQNVQSQLLETESGIEALKTNVKKAFKIVGALMIESSRDELVKDLNSKKEMIQIKVKAIEKQEEKIKNNIKEIQEEVIKKMKKDE